MHQYPTVTVHGASCEGMDVRWQDGPILRDMFNGCTVEALIRAAFLRLGHLNQEMPSEFNNQAMEHLTAALHALDARTADRFKRGVMGTEQA